MGFTNIVVGLMGQSGAETKVRSVNYTRTVKPANIILLDDAYEVY